MVYYYINHVHQTFGNSEQRCLFFSLHFLSCVSHKNNIKYHICGHKLLVIPCVGNSLLFKNTLSATITYPHIFFSMLPSLHSQTLF